MLSEESTPQLAESHGLSEGGRDPVGLAGGTGRCGTGRQDLHVGHTRLVRPDLGLECDSRRPAMAAQGGQVTLHLATGSPVAASQDSSPLQLGNMMPASVCFF